MSNQALWEGRHGNGIRSMSRSLLIAVMALLLTNCTQRQEVTFGADGCDLVPLQTFDGRVIHVGLRHQNIEDLRPVAGLGPLAAVGVKSPMPEKTYGITLQEGGGHPRACEERPAVAPDGPIVFCGRFIPATTLRLNIRFRPSLSLNDAERSADNVARWAAAGLLCNARVGGEQR